VEDNGFEPMTFPNAFGTLQPAELNRKRPASLQAL
jgi:hypothetical protein